MNYQETMNYIDTLGQYGSVMGLESITCLLEKLGNPQDKLAFVHIAGTNGKGSTLSYISNILMESHQRVGNYISPTLSDYRERIQVNQKPISKIELANYMTQVKEAASEVVAESKAHPTVFEMETALAFLYFYHKKCSIVVLETGMGGLLDATNVILAPLVAVITSVSMDHMAFLGDTLEKIALNKAGIIKTGAKVVCLSEKPEVTNVMKAVCEQKECPLTLVEVKDILLKSSAIQGQIFQYKNHKKLRIGMLGEHQLANASLALETALILQDLGFPITEKAIYTGLEKTIWLGRFSLVNKEPLVIVDGAHNEDAAGKLAAAVSFYFTNKKIIYIMGVLKDKEYEKIAGLTVHLANHVITITPPNNPRGLHAYELAKIVKEYNENVTAADSLAEALEMSYLLADEETVIIVFGSLSYLGEMIAIIKSGKIDWRDLHGKSRKNRTGSQTDVRGNRRRP